MSTTTSTLPPPDLSMLRTPPPQPPVPFHTLPHHHPARNRSASSPFAFSSSSSSSSAFSKAAGGIDSYDISDEQLAEWALKSGLGGFLPDPRLSVLGPPPPPPPPPGAAASQSLSSSSSSSAPSVTTATATNSSTAGLGARRKPMGGVATPFTLGAMGSRTGFGSGGDGASSNGGGGSFHQDAPVITVPKRRHSVGVGTLSGATNMGFLSKLQGPELFGIAEEWSANGEKTFSYKDEASSSLPPPPPPPESADKPTDVTNSSKPHKKDKQRRWSLRKALSRSSGSVDLAHSHSKSSSSPTLAPLREDEELSVVGHGNDFESVGSLADEEVLKKVDESLATSNSSNTKSSSPMSTSTSDKSENMKTTKMLRRRSTGFLSFNKKDKKEKAEEAKLRAKFEQEEKQHKHSGWQFIETGSVNDDLWKDQGYTN